jgi:RimJ/RimL family protein N-acetyltransferase
MFWIKPIRLELGPIALEPLAHSHVPGLQAAAADGELWKLWYTSIPTVEGMAEAVERRLEGQRIGTWLPFAVMDAVSGQSIGMTSYLHIERDVRRLEIGGTWYRRSAQGTAVNPACKMLLMRHAFEELACRAVELRTHALNAQSRRAIEGVGGKLDGILRNHFDAFGNERDTCVYSVIVSEWPTVKRHLAWRLSRFDITTEISPRTAPSPSGL